jgi:hypothetical protein
MDNLRSFGLAFIPEYNHIGLENLFFFALSFDKVYKILSCIFWPVGVHANYYMPYVCLLGRG